jgi:aryl-alcohol dehydrogenase (NADP+)
MERRPLGRTGVRVTPICLGTMTFGMQTDEKTACEIMDRALDGGVDFFDTADVYPLGGGLERAGETEAILGRWLAARGVRSKIFLATKCRGPMSPDPNDQGLSRYHVQRAVEASLRRLRTDVIDLYQTHAFDPDVPIDETLRALDDLVRAGKVRYVGCSNYPTWRLAEAERVARALGVARYESIQPRYNLLYREIETELLPYARANGLGVIVYNPIAGGLLSGKYRPGERPREGTRFSLPGAGRIYQHRYWDDVQLAACEGLAKEAEARGLALASVAVAWALAQPGVTSAIIGASRPDQLDATLAGATLALDPDLAKLCDEVWWRLPRRPVIEGYR